MGAYRIPRETGLLIPSGKRVLGAITELERSLIAERVKAGLRNAKAKGKRLERPKAVLDAKRIIALRAQGLGWKRIVRDWGSALGLSIGSQERIPKFGKGILELEELVQSN